MSIDIIERGQGMMIGVAVGDLLGSPVEGFNLAKDPNEQEFLQGHNEIEPTDSANSWKRGIAEAISYVRARGGIVTSYLGDIGTGFWEYGETTDDTAQTVLVAQSLIENKSFEPEDIAAKFVEWYNGGSGKGLGGTTGLALQQLDPIETSPPLSWDKAGAHARQMTEEEPFLYKGRNHASPYPVKASPSNGALMRTAPVGFYYRDNPEARKQVTEQLCRITHDFDACVGTAQLQTELIAYLANGYEKAEAVEVARSNNPETYENALIALEQPNEELGHTGGAYTTMGVALDAFISTDTFADAIISAINSTVLRKEWMNDVDTYGAVVGALAGTYYGFSAIPENWYNLEHPSGNTRSLTPYPVQTLQSLGRALVTAS